MALNICSLVGTRWGIMGIHYHLKVNKQASGRYKDLDDIEHLP